MSVESEETNADGYQKLECVNHMHDGITFDVRLPNFQILNDGYYPFGESRTIDIGEQGAAYLEGAEMYPVIRTESGGVSDLQSNIDHRGSGGIVFKMNGRTATYVVVAGPPQPRFDLQK